MARFNLGMVSDTTETSVPEGAYRFAKNIIDSNVTDAKENEDGFIACGVLAPYTVIGIIPVSEAFVVFSTNDTDSEIGLVERSGTTLNYTQIYNNPDLDFNTERPISGEFRVDVNGERVITFIESGTNANVPRILNIDDTSTINDINDLAVFQEVVNPSISTSSINDAGGSLTTGAKMLMTKYQNRDGSQTDWFVHDHVFYINDESKSLAFNLNDGVDGGIVSNKSISATFVDCDTRFDTLVIGYVQSINNIVTAYQTVKVQNSNTVTAVVTGGEALTEVSLSEVLVDKASYNNAKAITQLSGILYLANLTADESPDLQEIALDIEINYTSTLTNVISNTNSNKDNLPPGPIPGEVYAFYLGVELLKGGWRYYHIPGRTAVGTETNSTTSEGMTYLRYQINDTSNTIGAATNMGYWENENEVYPSTGGFTSVSGQNVRHHRFPTLDKLYTQDHSGSSTFGITHLPYLSITASNVNIPLDVQAKISRWKIFYAKKDTTNSLFTGSDLTMVSALPQQDHNTYWSTGGNWKTVTNGADGEWKECDALSASKLRIHSLDYLYNKDTPAPTYGRFIYKLNRTSLETIYSGFRGAGGKLCESGQVDSSTDGNEVDAYVVDYTTPSQTTRPSSTAFVKRLDNFSFVPSNSISNSVYTMFTEGVFSTTVNNPSTAFDYITSSPDSLRINSKGGNDAYGTFNEEKTWFVQLYRLLTDVHTSFLLQTPIPMEGYAAPSDTSLSGIQGGNGFLCYLSFLSCGPANADIDLPNDYNKRGVRAWHSYVGYSKYNLNYRYQVNGDISTYYHGKTDVRSLFVPNIPTGATESDMRGNDCIITLTDPQNSIEYNTDYNQVNEYFVGTIYDPNTTEETEFPNTIIYTSVQNEETKEFSWRSFPAGNRYVTPKDKGEITNLQGYNNKTLLINHKYSFYRTRTDIKAATEGEDVIYKSVSIFDLPPEEVMPTRTGYAGCQNKFACNLTKAGYFFVDDIQGKVFLFSDGLEEISKNNTRQFFRDFMKLAADNTDNPFTDLGYTTTYDERNNRLLFSKKGGDNNSWTISYNPAKKYWTSYHDYTPDYLFSTVDNVTYALKDNSFYITNIVTEDSVKGVFFGVEPYPSYIDLVFNPEPQLNKQFVSLMWTTEVYPNSYTSGQPDKTLDYSSTFTHATLRTLDQCTGEITLLPKLEYDDLYATNIRNINRNWIFDEIRDIALQTGFTQGFYDNFDLDGTKLNTNMEEFEQRKITDKFVICRLKYDNTDNKRLLFTEASINYRYAQRQ